MRKRKVTECQYGHGPENYVWSANKLPKARCRVCMRESLRKYRKSPKGVNYWKFYYASNRLKVIRAYGNKCRCCGEANIEFLTIDHVNNDGAAHKRQIKMPLYAWLKSRKFPSDGFQVLCMNCNFAKGKSGFCPHEAIRGLVEGVA